MSAMASSRPEIGRTVRKLGRTLQAHLPVMRDLGKSCEAALRRWTGSPHDPDFNGLRLIERPPAPLCLDIGANRGAAARSIRALWPDARIVCFEPLTPLAERLPARVGFPIEVHALALADAPGAFDLHVPVYKGLEFDGLASLDETAARSWLNADTLYGFRPDRLSLRRMPCAAETLDRFGYAPFFIKIDVQGQEFEVLQGGLRTILQHRPIILAENDSLDLERILALLAPAAYGPLAYRDGGWRTGGADAANLYLVPEDKRSLLRGLDR